MCAAGGGGRQVLTGDFPGPASPESEEGERRGGKREVVQRTREDRVETSSGERVEVDS